MVDCSWADVQFTFRILISFFFRSQKRVSLRKTAKGKKTTSHSISSDSDDVRDANKSLDDDANDELAEPLGFMGQELVNSENENEIHEDNREEEIRDEIEVFLKFNSNIFSNT